MRRITLAGPQLDAFVSSNGLDQPAFRSAGFDDAIRLHLPYPGATEAALPVQKRGRLEFGKDPRPLSKVYTVRRWDPESRALDLDFVKHGTGVATTWAYRASVGARSTSRTPRLRRSPGCGLATGRRRRDRPSGNRASARPAPLLEPARRSLSRSPRPHINFSSRQVRTSN
ncbi:siderophore-interacting protein [Aeromicrobium sp. UC242_57]|uniref:siderophore-interacting protein n=1 Tax=Aeromicrobium sp. UC242_57 TaxID=3374624 RepID=UPI0037B812A8